MMPALQVLFASGGLEVRSLSLETDLPLVEGLCGRCDDYYQMSQGESADAREKFNLFEEVPLGLLAADKLVLGLFDPPGNLAGVIEVLRGYRQPDDWYIGLMMLEPAARNRGAGRALHVEFVRWARMQGAKRLLLAVLEENTRARAFWQAQGYRLLKAFPPRAIGRKTHILEEMELPIR